MLTKRHKTARLNFAKEYEKKPDEYWQHILWSDETNRNESGSDGFQHVWHGLGQDYQSDYIVPTIKHGGRSVLIWCCMSAKGVGKMTFMDFTMNARLFTQIHDSQSQEKLAGEEFSNMTMIPNTRQTLHKSF